jgi:hypothetical protein
MRVKILEVVKYMIFPPPFWRKLTFQTGIFKAPTAELELTIQCYILDS